jgi:acetyl esterase/lipase
MHLPRPLVIAGAAPFFRAGLNHRLPVPVARRIIDAGAFPMRPLPRGVEVTSTPLGGRPAERVAPAGDPRRAVLYLHGGGYTVGSPKLYRRTAAHLALSADAVVFNLDYRLAPEHPYPAALDDAISAFTELVASHGYAADSIGIAGDSAGGGLAVATARALTDKGLRPGALALLSPWTDPADEDFHVRRSRGNDLRWGRMSAQLYRGDAAPDDPGYAPMYARLDGLPPMLIHVASDEMLHRQIHKFAARAQAAGADVTLVEQGQWWHSIHVAAGTLRTATDAVHAVGAYLRDHLPIGSGAVRNR